MILEYKKSQKIKIQKNDTLIWIIFKSIEMYKTSSYYYISFVKMNKKKNKYV